MPKAAPGQFNFTAGEVSPLVEGRTELDQVKTGLRVCLNQIPTIQGPLTKRPGTHFVAEVKDSSKETRLVRFEFSTTQAYVIEFGDLYCRFYKDNGQVTETGGSITGATAANPVVITQNAHGYSNGQEVYISGVGGMTQLNGRNFRVANITANTYELQNLSGTNINGTGYTAYTSGGTGARVYTVTTPYVEADLFELRFTQSADVLYIAHASYAPRKLTRTAHTAWTLSTISFQDGPHLSLNTTTTTLTLSGTSGSVTVTASAALFASTDVGRLIRWKDPANNWTWLTITAYTNSTVVTATISGPNASAGTATLNWRLGVWSGTTGYPAAVAFYEDRLFFGGGAGNPQRLDGSKSGLYENFEPTAAAGTVANDNAVSYTLASGDVNAIRWMLDDEKALLVATPGGNWTVRPSTASEALSPTNVSAKRFTGYGAADVQGIRAGTSTLYVQREGRTLRDINYQFSRDGFGAGNLSLASEHITQGGLGQLAFQLYPHGLIWSVRGDGVLIGINYAQLGEAAPVNGWHRHILGGAFGAGDTVVESVASIPSADGTRDELWVIAKRTINSRTVRSVEYMGKVWEDGDEITTDAFFVDCGLTYNGAATTTVTGLWHLEGQTVSVMTDGAKHPEKTVSSGSITLDWSATVVHVGLGYQSDGQLLRQDIGAANGTSQGKTQRIHRVGFRLYDTVNLKIGRDFDNLIEVPFRTGADLPGVALDPFRGFKTVAWDGGYSTDATVCWRHEDPLPFTLLGVMPQLDTQDRL